MTLTIKERLLLGAVLPREGSSVTLRVLRKLRESLSFSEEELAQFGFVSEGDGVRWRDDIPQDTEVEIGPKAFAIIQNTLDEFEKKGKLHEDFLHLWERFCEKGD